MLHLSSTFFKFFQISFATDPGVKKSIPGGRSCPFGRIWKHFGPFSWIPPSVGDGHARPTNATATCSVRADGPGQLSIRVGGMMHSAAIQIAMIASGDHTIANIFPPYEGCIHYIRSPVGTGLPDGPSHYDDHRSTGERTTAVERDPRERHVPPLQRARDLSARSGCC